MKRILCFLLALALLIPLMTGCDLKALFCEHDDSELAVDSSCTEKGYIEYTCRECGRVKREELPLSAHELQESAGMAPTCTEAGYRELACRNCSYTERETLPAAHSYGEWQVTLQPTVTADGTKIKTCTACGDIRQETISALKYIDTETLLFDYTEGQTYTASSLDEISAVFNAAVLAKSPSLRAILGFDYGSLDALLDALMEGCDIPLSPAVEASLLGEELTLGFTYNTYPTESTSSVLYTQYASANLIPYTPQRAADFDDFKINGSPLAYPVETGEQLVYVLERHARPQPKAGSPAAELYEKMKAILRQIVDDGMSETQKARAIYDYLVMNVVYDGALLNLMANGASNQSLAAYDGFYIEGVLNNRKAVCDGIAKAYCCLANIEGLRCVTVEGYQTQNPQGAGHAWNKIYIDGEWYIVDATSGGTVVNQSYEVLTYEFFLTSETAFSQIYTATNRQDILCTERYDYYTENHFVFGGGEHDYLITRQEEFNLLVSYLESLAIGPITLEFKVGYAVGSSLSDELGAALGAANAEASYSYLTGDNDIYTLIKRAS